MIPQKLSAWPGSGLLQSPLRGLRDMVAASPWYLVAIVAALLGGALDAWLSPVVIEHHAGTGELNPVSAFHLLDASSFAVVRVLAVVVATLLVAVTVARHGTSVWTHGSMAIVGSVNYANGAIALSSGLAAIAGSDLAVAHFLSGSLVAAVCSLAASLALLTHSRITSGAASSAADRLFRDVRGSLRKRSP